MRFPTIVIRSDVLESWLTVSDYSKSRLASELGVSKGRISQLLTSQEEPSAHLIAKLIALTYLPFDRLFMIVHHDSPRVSSVRFSNKTQKSTVVASSWAGRRKQGSLSHGHKSSPLLKGDK